MAEMFLHRNYIHSAVYIFKNFAFFALSSVVVHITYIVVVKMCFFWMPIF